MTGWHAAALIADLRRVAAPEDRDLARLALGTGGELMWMFGRLSRHHACSRCPLSATPLVFTLGQLPRLSLRDICTIVMPMAGFCANQS